MDFPLPTIRRSLHPPVPRRPQHAFSHSPRRHLTTLPSVPPPAVPQPQQANHLHEERLSNIRQRKGFICDLGGTVYKGPSLLEGVFPFLHWLKEKEKRVLFMTNTSIVSGDMIRAKLLRLGLDIPEDAILTSTMATARFIQSQSPNATAYILGENCLWAELEAAGINFSDNFPDYVVVGEKEYYSHEGLTKALNHVRRGARLIGTNPDHLENLDFGHLEPSCGAWISIIEKATGTNAYFVGKPNPLMMRVALDMLGLHATDTAVIGDNMTTDILAGVEAGLSSVLVLTGVSKDHRKLKKNKYAWLPYLVVENLGEIAPHQYTLEYTNPQNEEDKYRAEALPFVPKQLEQ